MNQVRGQILVSEPLKPFLNYTVSGLRQANNGEVLMGIRWRIKGLIVPLRSM
ncbi:hypothetical protein J2S16_002443 [Cytobacillus kochii]|nr:hypothetical protein [Cytobacillus kochii]